MLRRAGTGKQPVLLIEDNLADGRATVRSLRPRPVTNTSYRRQDGDTAPAFLYHRGRNVDATNASTPGPRLRNGHLPGTDGWTVLADIKRDPKPTIIPVVVRATSAGPRDIESCYEEGTDSYIQRPLGFNGLARAITRLEKYPFNTVLLLGREIASP